MLYDSVEFLRIGKAAGSRQGQLNPAQEKMAVAFLWVIKKGRVCKTAPPPKANKREMTLDRCLSLQAFDAVKGHFCGFLVSNILDTSSFFGFLMSFPSRLLQNSFL